MFMRNASPLKRQPDFDSQLLTSCRQDITCERLAANHVKATPTPEGNSMYDFDFLKKHRERIMVYKDIPLPVILCGKDLTVHWTNELARAHYPHLTETEGLRRALLEFDFGQLLREAVESGSCTIREIIPLSSVGMKITPLFEGGGLAGAVLVLLCGESFMDARSYYHTTRMSEALSDSIRGVVSEIFSILDQTAIKSELLNMGWIKSGLNNLAGNSYRILRVATNITEYARYQSELLNFRPRPVSLTAFFQDAQDTITRLAQSVGIPLRLSIPSEDFFVRMDCERFEYAFFNILHNSLYYTRPGNNILISLRPNKAGDLVTITVTDKGLGIPKDVLSMVTLPYYNYSHNKAHRDVGLGLAIAKLAASTHEGRLRIHSKEGEGTTVRFTLPLDKGGHDIGTLAQDMDAPPVKDRFSIAYVGLADVMLSPHNTLLQMSDKN